jgi:nicotinate-nucleotide pyrophosphorylase (carboxylating)
MMMSDPVLEPAVADLVKRALAEDMGERGDVTSLALVSPETRARAAILARQPVTVCGCGVAEICFRQTDADLTCGAAAPDGWRAAAGATLLTVQGSARSILKAERTALNFMQRLTGIATLTRSFVDIAQPLGVAVLDTRKTTPGLRMLEKYAVRCGGGTNHRMGLYDRFLIKDNHRALWAGRGRKSLADAVRQARETFADIAVEIEVESEDELLDALEAQPEWILLDNMSPAQIRRCVALCARRSRLEASGGIARASFAEYASTGVDAISLGCLTHSAPSADLSLEWTERGGAGES